MSGHSPSNGDHTVPGYGAVVNKPLTDAQKQEIREIVEDLETIDDDIDLLQLQREEVLNQVKELGYDLDAIEELLIERRTPSELIAQHEATLGAYRDVVATRACSKTDRPFAPPLDDGEKIGRAIFPSAEQQDRAMFAAKDATKN